MGKFNDSSYPPTDRPPESRQLLDADNQTAIETRENRKYPWFQKSMFLLVLLCALLLAGVIILTLQSRQIDQNTQSNSGEKMLFYLPYENGTTWEGRICLFDSHTNSVEPIARFTNLLPPNEVATTKDKIFALDSSEESFEIFDLNTRQITRGPDPPEWREYASVAYFKDKLYYLGGRNLDLRYSIIHIFVNGQWEIGPVLPISISIARPVICNGVLYVISGQRTPKVFRLSDDEREWIEIGEIPERRDFFGVASLNGRIYITGGSSDEGASKSCLCFDPSAPFGSRIYRIVDIIFGNQIASDKTSRIADMNHARFSHSLVAASGKLYAIGGFKKRIWKYFCNSIEEYDPQTNRWREVGKLKFDLNSDEIVAYGAAIIANALENGIETPLINNTMHELSRNISNLQVGGDSSFNSSHKVLFYFYYQNNHRGKQIICLFNSHNLSVEKVAKFHDHYRSFEVATTKDRIFAIQNTYESFEIYDLNTRQISRGLDLPEWRNSASVAYFKGKLYYLGGWDSKKRQGVNRVDVLIDGKWETGPAFPLSISCVQTIICDEVLYVIGGNNSNQIYKIYRLSDDEREWVEIGEVPEIRGHFAVASLNGKIYITGGWKVEIFDTFSMSNVSKSCWCFDPSAPVGSRISRIADMNYARHSHSLVVANGKLYAIGGFQELGWMNYCDSIQEYDPIENKWRDAGKLRMVE